jgi:hypothetical protein
VGTFLTVVLVVLAIGAILVLMAVNWARKKARNAKTYLVFGVFAMAVEALKQHAAKPENANDQELAALLKRAEAAEVSAKAALEKGEFDNVVTICGPILEELNAYKTALEQKRAEQAAQAAAQKPADVIDVEVHVVEPVLQLPAPTDSQADVQADVPVTPAAAPADSAADSGADSAAQVDTTAGAVDKPDSKK